MKIFHCDQCGQQVFFENIRCERCGCMLGYLSDRRDISAFEPAGDNLWRSINQQAENSLYRMCDNYAFENVCNWMISADCADGLCQSCQLTHVIPALNQAQNREYWYKLEQAKRRLLYNLNALNLPIVSKRVAPQHGLAFEFLEEDGSGHGVMTGHDDGLITLNIAEADDAQRERIRSAMNEPYRTLLGHFRHESGHYYFMRLIRSEAALTAFRACFGDERADYGDALEHYYGNGPAANWEQSYISAYATSHPWEDWAETWAHYLHMTATLETAHTCGVSLKPYNPWQAPLEMSSPETSRHAFDAMVEQWFALTYVLNSLNRSLGMPDGYPFTLQPAVIAKLRFVHDTITNQTRRY